MKRIYPHHIKDKGLLSNLLSQYLEALKVSPMQIKLKDLSVDTMIPESVFLRLSNSATGTVDDEVTPTDYHILFANLLFRYPTVKIWEQENHQWYFEM